MIVDVIFVALIVILIVAIYKIKFKNEAVKIANTNIHEIPHNGTIQHNTQQNVPS